MELSNTINEKLIVGFNKQSGKYYADKRTSGKSDVHTEFAGIHWAPRLSPDNTIKFRLIADVASIELFADDGLSVMTEVFFPNENYSVLKIKADSLVQIDKLNFNTLKSIW